MAGTGGSPPCPTVARGLSWRYSFTCRPRWLAPVADPIGRVVLRRDIDHRIAGFARGCADPVVLAAVGRSSSSTTGMHRGREPDQSRLDLIVTVSVLGPAIDPARARAGRRRDPRQRGVRRGRRAGRGRGRAPCRRAHGCSRRDTTTGAERGPDRPVEPPVGETKEDAASLGPGPVRLPGRSSSACPGGPHREEHVVERYGIPQALPGSKTASAGADRQTNPSTQARWPVSTSTSYGVVRRVGARCPRRY